MNSNPMFSIIIPAYNQGRYLGKALDSLLNQTEKDWEAIIVNDGSTDSTLNVATDYCNKDNRFRVISKENGGVASALNVGFDNTKGMWICWLSSDDLFDVRKLEIHKRWIEQYPDNKFFFTSYRLLYDETGKTSDPDVDQSIPETKWQAIELLRSNYIAGNSICIYRQSWQSVGKFNESMRYGQDYDMWLRLIVVYPAAYIPERTCITRIHKSQGTYGFPEAGIYDSSKAGIIFLKEHDFQSLFPLLDLKEENAARNAIIKAIDVSSDPASFLYGLGPHPMLVLRIIDWAYNECGSNIRLEIISLLRAQINKIYRRYKNSYFGYYWKIASMLCAAPSFEFNYDSISYLDVARNYYYEQMACDNKMSEPMGGYLEKFENLHLDYFSTRPAIYKDILIINSEKNAAISDDIVYNASNIANFFIRTGRTATIIGEHECKTGFYDGIFFINLVGSEFNYLLGSSLIWDAVIEFPSNFSLNDINARCTFILLNSYRDDINWNAVNRSDKFAICVSDKMKIDLIARGFNEEHIITIDKSHADNTRSRTSGPNSLKNSDYAKLINIIESRKPRRFIWIDIPDDIISIYEKIAIIPRWVYKGLKVGPLELKDKPLSEWPHVIRSLWSKFISKMNP